MNDTAQNEINKIATLVPAIIIEHALNLIEKMDHEHDEEYRHKLIHFMWQAIEPNEKFGCHCSRTSKYDIFHEFCIYLDGWLWYLDFDESDEEKDIEHSWVNLKKLTE